MIFYLHFSRDHVLTMLQLAPIFDNVNRRVTRHLTAQIFLFILIVSK